MPRKARNCPVVYSLKGEIDGRRASFVLTGKRRKDGRAVFTVKVSADVTRKAN